MSQSLPQPEPALSAEKLIERARALQPLLREQQAENDARGSYSDEIHKRLLDGGLYRVLQPRRFGGYECDLTTFVRIIMEIARGHPGAGWCYTLAASHSYVLAAHWPEQAQIDLFGADGDFRSPFVLGPSGTLKPAQGGYIVDGQWPFASGVPVSNHFMASGMIMRDGAPPQFASFILPQGKYKILPDWGGEKSLGVQASGSNSVRVEGAFVPKHHVITTPLASLMGSSLEGGTPGTRLYNNGMYLCIFQGWFATEFGAVFTGTARAALDEYERILRTKTMTLNPSQLRMHDSDFQRALGEAMGLTDAAETLTLAASDQLMALYKRFERQATPVTLAESMRIWSLAREATKLACEATEKLFMNCGASVGKAGERMQRYFRDAQMYRIHIQSTPRFPIQRALDKLGLAVPSLV